MEKYIIDFTGCKNLDEIHAQFKRVFDFPDYYGENWRLHNGNRRRSRVCRNPWICRS